MVPVNKAFMEFGGSSSGGLLPRERSDPNERSRSRESPQVVISGTPPEELLAKSHVQPTRGRTRRTRSRSAERPRIAEMMKIWPKSNSSRELIIPGPSGDSSIRAELYAFQEIVVPLEFWETADSQQACP